ncbi:dTDP-4-dehydrorhamnose 3,5-epimerase [Rhizomicrobium electricum]|jgi:dTDP-4-dehydrorhamnose 3,5-epimerase|uniref:dTDP-4-dehydrorhamnose 3,5-epimerase n=1 Tax=Rhizomicrobium electricum TaxID=480070 RepID=A0ABN1EME3_9PROT|nr:dTDP-4-dehydrorhamnose 3,5-epimerase [Rhizomicrobium electricum]NIJ46968.1 dTDP-4-dehydrorhamnose 3,5-epimerase [Rhizomicrobium electricum]
MNVIDTALAGVKIIEPKVFEDRRGFFLESWNARTWAEAGLDLSFVQENHSRSGKGVLRGLHYQIQNTQGKLIRVVAGRVFDVAVDIRKSSPNFGRWIGVELSAENRRQLWIPPGFAHGFLCLEDGSEFLYKCTDFYAPAHERSILWNDPAIGITWPLQGVAPVLSAKDQVGKLLADAEVFP